MEESCRRRHARDRGYSHRKTLTYFEIGSPILGQAAGHRLRGHVDDIPPAARYCIIKYVEKLEVKGESRISSFSELVAVFNSADIGKWLLKYHEVVAEKECGPQE